MQYITTISEMVFYFFIFQKILFYITSLFVKCVFLPKCRSEEAVLNVFQFFAFLVTSCLYWYFKAIIKIVPNNLNIMPHVIISIF